LFTLLYLYIVIISVLNRYHFPEKHSVKPANNEITRTNFSAAGNFRFIQVIEVWIRVTPDPLYCKCFPLKTGFPNAQVPFRTGFTPYNLDAAQLYIPSFSSAGY